MVNRASPGSDRITMSTPVPPPVKNPSRDQWGRIKEKR